VLAGDRRYRAASGIRMLDFGDEFIVFNPLSWDAHLLKPCRNPSGNRHPNTPPTCWKN
jgi:hypothetical protein